MSEETQEAASVSGEAESAETQGQEAAEVETEGTATEGAEATEEATGEEGEQGGDEPPAPEEKGPKKLTASERIQQEIERRKELERKVSDLQTKWQAEQEAKKAQDKPFVEVDLTKVERHISTLQEEADNLRLEGRVLEAARKDRERIKLVDMLDENDSKRTEWEKQQTEKNQDASRIENLHKALDSAADFYREHNKIPQEVFSKAAEFFAEARRTDPLLDRQYAEVVQYQGPMAAIRFAHDYVTTNMGKQAAEAKQQKEAAKATTIGGVGGTTKGGPKSYQDLLDGPSAKLIDFAKNNPKEYDRLYRAHMTRRR